MRRKFYEEDLAGQVWCNECKEETTSTMVDIGIGPYEFWGHRSVHTDYRELTVCCHAEFQEYPFEEEDDE